MAIVGFDQMGLSAASHLAYQAHGGGGHRHQRTVE
jgi:hypothetical protein